VDVSDSYFSLVWRSRLWMVSSIPDVVVNFSCYDIRVLNWDKESWNEGDSAERRDVGHLHADKSPANRDSMLQAVKT
jgi:hypothetical protein